MAQPEHAEQLEDSWCRRWLRKRQASAQPGATSAVLMYSACSVTMVLTNKAIAMLPAWRKRQLILLPVILQASSAIVLLVVWESCLASRRRWQRLAKERGLETGNMAAEVWAWRQGACLLEVGRGVAGEVWGRLWPGWRNAMRCLPCAAAFAAMILTGFLALGGIPVPFVTVGKNAANSLTALGEWLLLGSRPGRFKVLALAIMLFGAFASAWNDLGFTADTYLWLALNCATTSAYVLMMRVLSLGGVDLPGKEASIALNNLFCLMLLLPIAWSRGEIRELLQTGSAAEADDEALFSPTAITLHVLAGLCAFLLNFATMRCVKLTSALTYSM
ncbi:unnamed protein product, partial [Polarella glacialis]